MSGSLTFFIPPLILLRAQDFQDESDSLAPRCLSQMLLTQTLPSTCQRPQIGVEELEHQSGSLFTSSSATSIFFSLVMKKEDAVPGGSASSQL